MTHVIEGAGVPLAVQDHGEADAPVVLLVHGMAADALTWGPAAAELVAGGLRVITYDRRGYGGSGAPEPYTGTTVAEQTADAVAVLDGLGVPGAIIAGDGFGALVALDLALRFPQRVTALVCADPPLFLFVPDAARALAQQRAQLEDALRAGGPAAAVAAWLDGRVEDAALVRAQASPLGFFADYAGLASLAVTRRELRGVRTRTVVVTGSFSPPDVVVAADALAGLLPEARREPAADLVTGVQAVAA
jgi:pimeloyl-ACP methyl ester carboxylesterase